MKTLGLLVTTALLLPLSACIRPDRCDSHGRCDDSTGNTPVCFYDQDCGPGYRCDGGSCVARLPAPPPRGTSNIGGAYGGIGGATGAAGSGALDAGVDHRGSGGAPGVDGGVSPPPPDGGVSPPPPDGGVTPPPADGGAPHACDAGGGGTPGSCHPRPTPVCQFDHACGLGRCIDGACQAACESSVDCGTGQACAQGYCVTAPTSGGQCVYNADCGASATCINGYCHANCGADADCAAHGLTQGQTHDRCVAGICQPDTGAHPQCRASADCVGVHVTEDVCVDAVCRTPCLSDSDCCVGSSGSVCQMGYCVTAHEISPQCQLSADCAEAQACIDAACE